MMKKYAALMYSTFIIAGWPLSHRNVFKLTANLGFREWRVKNGSKLHSLYLRMDVHVIHVWRKNECTISAPALPYKEKCICA